MITSIEIENLRGIRTGKLEGLTPLTILTGPNACGKSTVLDSLLIAAGPSFEEAVGRAVQRHPEAYDGARWLFGTSGTKARLVIAMDSGSRCDSALEWLENCDKQLRSRLLESQDARSPFSMISIDSLTERLGEGGSTGSGRIAFDADNRYTGFGRRLSETSSVRLVDPGLPIALHRAFTEVSRMAGRRDDVDDLLSTLVPDYEQLEILVGNDDRPSLHMRSAGRSVPVGLAGDGIQAFVQMALEIAIAPEGLVLLEEPEVYQHPKAIWQSARVLLANIRRGVQTVLTTHSLELIDALLATASPDDLEKMSVFNLLLEDGKLSSGRRAGEEIAFARQTLENDLR
jgi:energy-coupling factor transporter ATP-binding protein EcfA2